MRISDYYPRENGRDYAFRMLRDNIISLDLEPGSMVSEKELSDELGLSRTPVREALIDLSKVQIVEIYPQRGSRISLIDYNMVEEARFLRETLELAIVREVCRSVAPEALAPLEENMKLQDFYLTNNNPEMLLQLDNQFHKTLFELVHKEHVYQLSSGLNVHFDRVRSMSLVSVKGNKTVGDHRQILNALEAGDADAAQQLIEKHLMRYKIDEAAIRTRYPTYFKPEVVL